MQKFINKKCITDYEILTDTGWEDIIGIGKTKLFQLFKITTKSFFLECADTHIVFDKNFNEVFVKDLVIGDYIQTKNGIEEILEYHISDVYENMYDLELNEGNRRYYTNGILSHNSIFLSHCTTSLVKTG